MICIYCTFLFIYLQENKDKEVAHEAGVGIDMPNLDATDEPQQQQEQHSATPPAENAEGTESDASQNAIDQAAAAGSVDEQQQHHDESQLHEQEQEHSGEHEVEQPGVPVSMPSLDDDGEGSQPSNTDQVPMDIDELQNAAESGQIKFILNENGQLLQLDNHILTTDADGNQILVQGTDSEQIQQLLQSVGVLQGDGDGETFQMIQGENNQMILVQGDNNEAQLIDASMLNEDGHLVIQQHGDGEEMHVVNEDGVQVPVSIAFAHHQVDDGSEQQQTEIKMDGDSQDGQTVQVAVTEDGGVVTTTTATPTVVTSPGGEVYFNLEDLMNQQEQKVS